MSKAKNQFTKATSSLPKREGQEVVSSPQEQGKRRKVWKGVFREMAMTIVATSISIVLTFGTGMWLDNRQKKEDGRQMAMMVIHDMEVNVDAFNLLIKDEAENYNLACYVMDNLETFDSIPNDTLARVWEYIKRRQWYVIDDSKEKIFNSSQETWKNIDNAMFIDLVQDFYINRRTYASYFEQDVAFRCVLSEDDEYQLRLNAPSYYVPYDREVMKTLLSDKKVVYYILLSQIRRNFFEQVATEWKRRSDQCKFLMGITDEELEEYIDNQKRMGNPVRESELVGTWESSSTSAEDTETITFCHDHTFTHERTQGYDNHIYEGRLIYNMHMTGTWRIEGDTLVRQYDKGVTYDIDTSSMRYSTMMKDSIEHFIAEAQRRIDERNEQGKNQSLGRRANAAVIDKSGNKIELSNMAPTEYGIQTASVQYITRKKL